MKNILLVNTERYSEKLIADIFSDLESRGYFFHILFYDQGFLNGFSESKEGRLVKKVKPGFNLDTFLGRTATFILLPLLCLKQTITLSYIKLKKKPECVICFSNRDRLIFTPVARLLRLKVLWLERVDLDYSGGGRFLIKILRSLSNRVNRIIVFNQASRLRLEEYGFKKDKIKNVNFSLNPNQEQQDNLFSNLAKKDGSNSFRSCFSLGLVADLDNIYYIENFFQSIKICLDVSSDLRVVIIGEGKEKKRISWLARQENLENIIYLVGGKMDLGRWWESFDVYLAWAKQPRMRDFQIGLEAMRAQVPVIAHKNKGWEELVEDGKTGFLVAEGDVEELAQKILHLQQRGEFRLEMGKEASNLVKEKFSFSNQIQRLTEEV